jgi:hypothetical protein
MFFKDTLDACNERALLEERVSSVPLFSERQKKAGDDSLNKIFAAALPSMVSQLKVPRLSQCAKDR